MNEPEPNRTAQVERKTGETDISVRVTLGSRNVDIATGIGFFDHMLHALGFHGALGLEVKATGDLHVDYHHVVEDTGIVLGKALRKAVGPDPALARFASAVVPMDESLALAAVDVSGRGGAFFDDQVGRGWVRDFSASLCLEFFRAFAREAGMTMHVRLLAGEDTHHRIEAAFKAIALCLKQALTEVEGASLSTKGSLEKRDDL